MRKEALRHGRADKRVHGAQKRTPRPSMIEKNMTIGAGLQFMLMNVRKRWLIEHTCPKNKIRGYDELEGAYYRIWTVRLQDRADQTENTYRRKQWCCSKESQTWYWRHAPGRTCKRPRVVSMVYENFCASFPPSVSTVSSVCPSRHLANKRDESPYDP